MTVKKQVIYVLLIAIGIFSLAVAKLDLQVDNQHTAYIDAQYYNFLIRNYALNDLIIITPNPQTLGFLFFIYPTKYIPQFLFPAISLLLLLFLILYKNRDNADRLWAILPMIPYMVLPSKECVLLLVALGVSNSKLRAILMVIVRPVMILLSANLKPLVALIVFSVLGVFLSDQILRYESENAVNFIVPYFTISDYGLISVVLRLLLFWPLFGLKILTLNFFSAPNLFSLSITLANLFFVLKFRNHLLKIMFHRRFMLISSVVSGLFFFQMQRVATMILVLFILTLIDEKEARV
tara:strand:- start:298 stop:1179 length:882 start_codon:yes stop_codon:yes gene_type:complete